MQEEKKLQSWYCRFVFMNSPAPVTFAKHTDMNRDREMNENRIRNNHLSIGGRRATSQKSFFSDPAIIGHRRSSANPATILTLSRGNSTRNAASVQCKAQRSGGSKMAKLLLILQSSGIELRFAAATRALRA